MGCYEPNIILFNTYPKTLGEKLQKIKFINAKGINFKGYEWYQKQNEEFKKQGTFLEYAKVPCQHCIGCVEKHSKEWAVRQIHEAQQWKENYFITLTYDDEHLPQEDYITDKSGKQYEADFNQGQITQKDVQDFIKRIRKYYSDRGHENIRYLYCSEYGGEKNRPHYHINFFNLPLDPNGFKVYKARKDGTVLYNHDLIDKKWGKGFAVIEELNWDTCAYVARYIQKKWTQHWSKEVYYKLGLTPEYIRMSLKPAIGYEYFIKHQHEIYSLDEILYKGHKTNISRAKPPSYYDKKFEIDYPEYMEDLKNRRKALALSADKLKNQQSSLPEADRLQVEKRTKLNKMNQLKRNLENKYN